MYLFRDEGTGYAVPMIDQKDASRDALVRLIVAQHDTIAQQAHTIAAQQAHIATLDATVVQLSARVDTLLATIDALRRDGDDTDSGAAHGMPGLKPATGKPRPTKRPRKPRRQSFVRRRAEPTQRILHACARCPTCGMALTGGSVMRTREVIEVPLAPGVVTEHVYLERRCPHCRTRVLHVTNGAS